MPYRALITVLMLLSFSGCTVYGSGYDRGYSHYSSHHHHNGYRRDYAPPVYITPRYDYYERQRHDRHRYDGKRYAPAPRYQGFEQRHPVRYDSYSRHGSRQLHKQYQAAPSRHWQHNRHQQMPQRYSRDGRHSHNEVRGSREWRRD